MLRQLCLFVRLSHWRHGNVFVFDFLAPKEADELGPEAGIGEEVDQRIENGVQIEHGVHVSDQVVVVFQAAELNHVHDHEYRHPAHHEQYRDEGTHDYEARATSTVVAFPLFFDRHDARRWWSVDAAFPSTT